MRQIDFVIGKIEQLNNDKEAGWEAYFQLEYKYEELLEKYNKLRRKKNGGKIQRKLEPKSVSKGRLQKPRTVR